MTIENSEECQLRIIKTARTLSSINEAVENGFFPLVKRLSESEELNDYFGVFRNRAKIGRAHV